MDQARHFRIVCPAMAIFFAPLACSAGNLIDGTFESSTHPAWEAYACSPATVGVVQSTETDYWSFARMVSGTSGFHEASICQDDLMVCDSSATYINVQFDARTSLAGGQGDSAYVSMVQGCGTGDLPGFSKKSIPDTSGQWMTFIVSHPVTQPTTFGVDFRLRDVVTATITMDIDNVRIFGSNQDLSTLCNDFTGPSSQICFSGGINGVLPGAGAGQNPSSDLQLEYADTNNDCMIDFIDLNEVLDNWGATDPCGCGAGDANGDGVVDFADLDLVVHLWNQVPTTGPCSPATTCP